MVYSREAVSKELGVAVATCQYRLMPLGDKGDRGRDGVLVEPMVFDMIKLVTRPENESIPGFTAFAFFCCSRGCPSWLGCKVKVLRIQTSLRHIQRLGMATTQKQPWQLIIKFYQHESSRCKYNSLILNWLVVWNIFHISKYWE